MEQDAAPSTGVDGIVDVVVDASTFSPTHTLSCVYN